MDQSLEKTNTSLTISRVLRASPEEVWQLWTDPAKVNDWHRPNKTDYITQSKIDLRIGGAYKISMTSADGSHTAIGIFKELNPPHKLVYSWQWEGDPSAELSEVTLTLDPVPEGTKLTLVHDRLSGPESVNAHSEGWLGCMGNINEVIR